MDSVNFDNLMEVFYVMNMFEQESMNSHLKRFHSVGRFILARFSTHIETQVA